MVKTASRFDCCNFAVLHFSWDMNRVWQTAKSFAEHLLFAVFIALSGLFLKWLIRLSVGQESKGYEIIATLMDVAFLGAAAVVAVSGAILVIFQTISSTWESVRAEQKDESA